MLKATQVYPGMYVQAGPQDQTAYPHQMDKYYFGPLGYACVVPFSPAFDSQDQAERAAEAWESRYELEKLARIGFHLNREAMI